MKNPVLTKYQFSQETPYEFTKVLWTVFASCAAEALQLVRGHERYDSLNPQALNSKILKRNITGRKSAGITNCSENNSKLY